MGLSGTIDSAVYEGLTDVLHRYPVVTRVTYEPDSITKTFLRARIDSARLDPSIGPHPPTLDVEWRFTADDQYYRIHLT